MNSNTFAVIGGDARYAMLASLLAGDGYTVFCAGLAADTPPHSPGQCMACLSPIEAAASCEAVILPMPPTADGANLAAPLSSEPIPLNEEFGNALRGKRVFAGLPQQMRDAGGVFSDILYEDYYADEAFQVRNAEATAEGALAVAIQNMPATICGSQCLVAGYGRIGRQVAPMLRALGGKVTVAARSPSCRAYAESSGMRAVNIGDMPAIASEIALTINTVPVQVIGKEYISKLVKSSSLIIDLASRPGGVDFAAAARLGVKSIHALGLPGLYSPLTAAGIIKDTVLSMLF